jgi:hypothetical protein
LRFAKRDEERQALMDLAAERGVELSNERATRAAVAGTTSRLRARLVELSLPPDLAPESALEASDEKRTAVRR